MFFFGYKDFRDVKISHTKNIELENVMISDFELYLVYTIYYSGSKDVIILTAKTDSLNFVGMFQVLTNNFQWDPCKRK